MAEVEYAGVKISGGKMLLVLPLLGTLGGAAWGGFEFYKDYMDMKEIIQNIDTTEIQNQQEQINIKLDEAIDYTRDIKTGLRDDILSIEKQVDRVEDNMNAVEDDVRSMIDNAEERFENKRDALQNDYDQSSTQMRKDFEERADRLTTNIDRELKELEDRLGKKLQRALDNPLAN